MIWKRQQYIAHCQYEFTGREMFCELFGPLAPLETEWRAQGATEKEIGMAAFDWDYVLKTGLSAGCGPITGLTPTVLSWCRRIRPSRHSGYQQDAPPAHRGCHGYG